MKFLEGLNSSLKAQILVSLRDLWCHTSTAIEGNTLSLGETHFVLSEGLTVSGKPLKDHIEIHGHAKAIDLIYGMLGKGAIDEQDLFLLHKAIVAENVMDIYKPIGAWKTEPNYTSYVSSSGKPAIREYPSPTNVPALMRQWIEHCNDALAKQLTQDEAVAAYANLHLAFVTIHPFFDGNGRMARLVSNLPVMKAGFPPIIVPKEDRKRYLETVSAYQEKIADLVGLRGLDSLPPSSGLAALCREYWKDTLEIVSQARKMQRQASQRRDQGLDR